jgi:outer membrane autotransporter protein
LNLSKGIVVVSMVDDGPEGNSLFEMTGGEINMDQSYLGSSKVESGNERAAGTSKLSGGTVNANKGRNIFLMDNPTIGNTINIAQGATLEAYDHYTDADSGIIEDIVFSGKTTLNLTDAGAINLNGKLVSDVAGNGALNIKSSNALVDGNVSGSNLNFETDHTLSKAVSGTIGNLASLNINKGTLTYDKATGKIGNLNVAGALDIGTNTVEATNVDFKDNSKLALRVSGADNYGKINASTINIGNDTTMNVTLDNGVVANGESAEFKFLNGTINGNFENKIAENSRYAIEWADDGSLSITGQATSSDVVADAGGSAANAATAEAWDSINSSSSASEGAKAVASTLNELSQNATTPAGKKAYIDALTAVAPEVALMVQKTQVETSNQVFGAVGTRLSGGSVSTGGKGMASGDSMFERAAMWVQGMFNKSKLDDTSKAKGFDADSSGVAFGFEKFVTDNTKAGIGYAYTKTDIDGFMRDTDVDTHTAIVYGEYKPSNWYVNGIATYGWSDYSEKKNVSGVNVKADYDVETIGLQAMTGYDMNVNGLGITPEAGLRYVHIKQDSYKDSADQRVSANDSDILTGIIGAKVSKDFELSNGMTIKPEARVAATYDLMNDDVNSVVTLANGSAYAVEGEALDRFGMEFGAGVTAEVNDNIELSLGYEGKFRQDYQDHTGLLNVKYKF